MSVLAFRNSLLMLAMLRDEFLMNDDALLLLMGIIMFFLDGPLVVILIQGLGLL